MVACALIALGVWVLGVAQQAPDAKALAEQAQARAAAVAVDGTPGAAVDRERVRQLAEQGLARGRVSLEEMIRRHEGKLQNAPETATPGGAKDDGSESKGNQAVSGRLVVALSSSMPESMLREYMRQLAGIPEAIVILRGFIGGARTVAPTGIWVEQMRREQASCRTCAHRAVEVVVDPLSYRMLGIAKVPAVAYLPGVQDLKHCDAEKLQASAVIYGAVSVASALKQLDREGVAVPPALLARLEKRT